MSRHFDTQVSTLVRLGYPAFFGLTAEAFGDALQPLRQHVAPHSETTLDPQDGTLPFVLVIRSAHAPARATLPLIERRSLAPVERLFPKTPEDFVPIDSVSLPDGDAYLLQHIDRGADTLNVTPDDAHERIKAQGRSPLTLEEGIAVLTHFPEFLQPNNCFSLLASRCGDKRVPALWLSEGRPKLGWCWAGNPHTWLGSASCGARVGGVRMPVSAHFSADEATHGKRGRALQAAG